MTERKKITQEQLSKRLELHSKWFYGENGGAKANLSGLDLSGFDLSEANLNWANLRGADLSNTNLSGAELRNANLREASFYGSKGLNKATLDMADVEGTDFRAADLSNASLYKVENWEKAIRDKETILPHISRNAPPHPTHIVIQNRRYLGKDSDKTK